MRKFCVYGKGGIGKSTIVSNVAAAFSEMGKKVMVIGCDPKADTTRNLMGRRIPTVLDVFRDQGSVSMTLEEVIFQGFGGIYCIESGGPEPGVGCAGRGIITAIDLLNRLEAFKTLEPEVVIFDVLGDVVCGGFAMPLREMLAEDVYIVTTCDPMALYAANNISKGIERHAKRGNVLLGGLIHNGRSVVDRADIIDNIATEFGSKVVGYLPMTNIITKAEIRRKTVIEYSPESPIADSFRSLATAIYENTHRVIPQPLSDAELEKICDQIEESVQAIS
jgi:nitrogenase iron protein NifH